MKQAVLIAIALVLGATPAPPETPRPGQPLLEASAAVMAAPEQEARRPLAFDACRLPVGVMVAEVSFLPPEPVQPGFATASYPRRSNQVLLRRTSQGPPSQV